MRKVYFLLLLLIIDYTIVAQENDLDRLEKFSQAFTPLANDSMVVIYVIPDNHEYWKNIISNAYKIDSLKTNKDLTFILLKLYRFHLTQYHQYYRLPHDPFIDAFLKINGFYESEFIKSIPKELIGDVITSSLVYDWLRGDVNFGNHKTIKKDKAIREEMYKLKKMD